jgi:hypothetical protein
MAKKVAIGLPLLMLAVVAWGLLLERHAVTIVINGEQVSGPLKDAIGAGGFVVGLIALFCVATLLVFVFAGIGLFVLGGMVLMGLILVWLNFPFLLVLIPLAILWVFVSLRTTGPNSRLLPRYERRPDPPAKRPREALLYPSNSSLPMTSTNWPRTRQRSARGWSHIGIIDALAKRTSRILCVGVRCALVGSGYSCDSGLRRGQAAMAQIVSDGRPTLEAVSSAASWSSRFYTSSHAKPMKAMPSLPPSHRPCDRPKYG